MRYSTPLSQPEIHFALERAAESTTEPAGAAPASPHAQAPTSPPAPRRDTSAGNAGTPRLHVLAPKCALVSTKPTSPETRRMALHCRLRLLERAPYPWATIHTGERLCSYFWHGWRQNPATDRPPCDGDAPRKADLII